jgi:hypothetical protein
MRQLGQFCRARQAVSHKSESLSQIAVVFSKESLYRTTGALFGGWGKATDPARGWLDALIDSHYSVDVQPDWKLTREALKPYRLIVFPEWAEPGEAAFTALLAWVEQEGGTLVASGAGNAARLSAPCGFGLLGAPGEQRAYVAGRSVLGNVSGQWQSVHAGTAVVIAQRYPDLDTTRDGEPAALSSRLGRGEVICIPGAIGGVYAASHAPMVREFLRAIVAPRVEWAVSAQAPAGVEMVVRRKGNLTLIHLINTTNMQVAAEYSSVEAVPEVGPVELTLRGAKPAKVWLVPEGTRLAIGGTAGAWKIRLERLGIQSVVTCERAG